MNTPVHSIDFHHAVKLARWSRILSMALIGVNALVLSTGYSQSPQPSVATAPALRADLGPTAAITFSNGSSLKVRSDKSGDFPMVAAEPGESVSIQVRFPTNLGRTGLVVQVLDGGRIPKAQENSSLAADGTASIQFQTPSLAGSCRILLIGSGMITTLNFWVADPQNQSSNAAALKP